MSDCKCPGRTFPHDRTTTFVNSEDPAGFASYAAYAASGRQAKKNSPSHNESDLSCITCPAGTTYFAEAGDFEFSLGPGNKNRELPPRLYSVKMAKLGDKERSGDYATRMIEVCNRYGMKPLCDHRAFCGKDPRSIYIGQHNQFMYPPHRNRMDLWPEGWSLELASKWDGLCE